MPLINSIASLVVDIVTNTAQFNQGLNVVKNDLQNIGNQINLNLTEKTNIAHSSFVRLAAQVYTVVHAVRLLTQVMELVVTNSKDVETAFFNIERVTGRFNDSELRKNVFGNAGAVPLADLQKSLADTSKLGLSAKNALDAAKIISQLGFVAGDKGEKFNEDFIRLIEVFKLSGKDIERFANTLIQLSKTFQVTEEDLIASTQKFASFAKMIGLTSQETLAFVAAMRGTGQPGQVATNALTTLFEKLEGDSKKVALAFRLTASESEAFANKLRQHPVAAIRELLEILSRKSPTEVVEILKDLEISGVRNASAIFALSNNLDILDAALQNANAGFANNVLLQQQVIAKTDTLQGHINSLSNAWTEFLFAVGTSSIVVEALERITDALKAIDELLGHGAKEGLNANNPASLLAEINRLKAALALLIKEQDAEGQMPAATALAQRLLRGREGDPEWLKKRISELEDLYNKLTHLKSVVTAPLPKSIDPNLDRPAPPTKEEIKEQKANEKAYQKALAEERKALDAEIKQAMKDMQDAIKEHQKELNQQNRFANSRDGRINELSETIKQLNEAVQKWNSGFRVVPQNMGPAGPLKDLIEKLFIQMAEQKKELGWSRFSGFMGFEDAWKNLIIDKENDPHVRAINRVKDGVKDVKVEMQKFHIDFNKRTFPAVVVGKR